MMMAVCLTVSSCGSGSSNDGSEAEEDSVYVSEREMNATSDELDALAGANMEMRKDLYRILLEMDNIAGDAFVLERDRENNGAVKNKSMVERINMRMASVKKQLEEAREKAGNNEQLRSTIDMLERSISVKEQEIKHLNTIIKTKDEQLHQAYNDLQEKHSALEIAHSELTQTNQELRQAKQQLQDDERNSWVQAGDALVQAAKMIPRPKRKNATYSLQVKNAKLRIMNKAIECYNRAIRLGDHSAEAKGHEVNRLQNLVRANESIGEEEMDD